MPGTSFSLGSLTLPSVMGMSFAFGGMIGVTALLMTDREDGTLLRAKATPDGMTAYVIGQITRTSATNLFGIFQTRERSHERREPDRLDDARAVARQDGESGAECDRQEGDSER